MHRAMLADERCFQYPRSERPGPGLLGFPYGPALRAEIAACDLFALSRWPSPRVTVIQSGDVAEAETLVNRLGRQGISAQLRRAANPVDWEDLDAVGHSLTAGDLHATIRDALLEDKG